MYLSRERGAAISMTGLLSGDIIGSLNYQGGYVPAVSVANPISYAYNASTMNCVALENFSSTAGGTTLTFNTVPLGTNSGTIEVLRMLGPNSTSGSSIVINSTNDARNATIGSIMTFGGLAVSKNIYIGSTTNAINNSTGSIISSGGAGFNGDIYANNIYTNNIPIVYGTNFNYTSDTVGSSTNSALNSTKLTMTTGNLISGIYKITTTYIFAASKVNASFTTSLYQGNTNGTLLATTADSVNINTDRLPEYFDVITTLSGVQNFILVYHSDGSFTGTISDARLTVYRIA